MRSFALLSLSVLYAGCASAPPPKVEIMSTEVITAADMGSMQFMATRLFNGLETGEAKEHGGQTLALFGREDLIAEEASSEYKPRACALIEGGEDPLEVILSQAENAQVVIVNESHVRSSTRAFIEDIALGLAPLGFDTFAAETFNNHPESGFIERFDNEQKAPFRDRDGFYSSEAAFGRLIRSVQDAGYTLVSYEKVSDPKVPRSDDVLVQIARREEAQANNLINAIFAQDPDAKVLIHVGYSHAKEEAVTTSDGESTIRWMAARLKEKTGIDPLTVDQTLCRGNAETGELALAGPIDNRPMDIIIDRPLDTFVSGRPAFRLERGDIAVSIPAEIRPETGWRIIEAYRSDQVEGEVPMDRVAVEAGEDVHLMLPPGQYHLRAITPNEPTEE